MKYLFERGSHPDISTAELEAVFAQDNISIDAQTNSQQYLIIETSDTIDTKKLLTRLGGTIKIADAIKQNGDIQKSIVHFLHTNTQGKIHFSLHGNDAKKRGLTIKKELKSIGHSVRYIEANNSATIIHNNLIEKQGDFTIVGNDVFVTTAIQDIAVLSSRDFERPGFDATSGMLPPKLARMMIHIAGISPKQHTILDPFCGSGTILNEALLLGFAHIIGSDNSQKACSDSQKNIDWLIETHTIKKHTTQLIQSNAENLNSHITQHTIDLIVSEPYMGKPLHGHETKEEITEQTKELKQLYIKSFATFYNILKPDAVIIFIIPRFKYKQEWITIDCVANILALGFRQEDISKNNTTLLYHRSHQHVGREIFRFKKIIIKQKSKNNILKYQK